MASPSSSFFPIRHTPTVLVVPPAPIQNNENSSSDNSNRHQQQQQRLQDLLRRHPVPKHFSYGTAGFRDLATVLSGVFVRVGLAIATCQQSVVGIMVTASHNDERYNGIKLVQYDGSMMSDAVVKRVVEYVNHTNVDALVGIIEDVMMESLSLSLSSRSLTVHVGYDTRCHSPRLVELLTDTLLLFEHVKVIQHGIVTTPQLHFCVRHSSKKNNKTDDNEEEEEEEDAQEPTVQGYYHMLTSSYQALLETADSSNSRIRRESPTLLVDCACGVGYLHLQELLRKSSSSSSSSSSSGGLCLSHVQATNAPRACRDTTGFSDSCLNAQCGSEHVEKTQSAPTCYDDMNVLKSNDNVIHKSYCASLDGDADRIVFFRETPTAFHLFNGDKIACLLALFVQRQLQVLLPLNDSETASSSSQQQQQQQQHQLRLGVVQTAYANGASTAYLQNLLGGTFNVLVAKTGVRHLHAVAVRERLDIGIYFEANGHGTILFGKKYYAFLREYKQKQQQQEQDEDFFLSAAQKVALERLRLLPNLINQAVGDALSDLLLVDAILYLLNYTMDDWHGLYQDLCSKQLVVHVNAEAVKTIVTNEMETRCKEPARLQTDLDHAVLAVQGGGGGGGRARAFCRPSGTEPVVRIYAEAATQEQADALAVRAAEIVKEHCCSNNNNSKGSNIDAPPSKM